MSPASVQEFHARPENLRYKFEDQYAMSAWKAGQGSSRVSTAVAPLHTIFDRRA